MVDSTNPSQGQESARYNGIFSQPAPSLPPINLDELFEFLKCLDAAGRHQLVAMREIPGQRRSDIESQVFEADEWEEMEAWATRHRRWNIYFTLNEPRAGLTQKASEDEIINLRALAIDLDPRDGVPLQEERTRLRDLISAEMEAHEECFPSAIIDSGGGFLVVWVLADKIPATPENIAPWQAQVRGLVKKFGADDACLDAPRIFRAPGTINLPNASKRNRGRQIAPARLLDTTDQKITLAELATWVAPKEKAARVRRKGDDPEVFCPDDQDGIETGKAAARFYADHVAPEAISGARGNPTTVAVVNGVLDYVNSPETCVDVLTAEGGWNDTKTGGDLWTVEELQGFADRLWKSREFPVGRFHPEVQPLLEFGKPLDGPNAGEPWASAEELRAFIIRAREETKRRGERKRDREASAPLPPLTIAEWLGRDLPEPDWLMGSWLSTTSRALLVAPTGLGKTNFSMALAMHAAAGRDFLGWKSRRPARVLYIDGEMARRLFRQRIADAARRLGEAPPTFYGLSHEDIAGFAPLNTPEGRNCIERLIERIGPLDLITFDSVMCLTTGDPKDPEAWQQVMPWVRSLTKRNTGQIWVHHTGLDETRGYGDKTREWQLDLVAHMSRIQRADTDVAFMLEFRKARERTPETRSDFADVEIALVDDTWTSKRAAKPIRETLSPVGRRFFGAVVAAIKDTKADDGTTTDDAWRDMCIRQGLLDAAKKDSIRSLLSKYRRELIVAHYIEYSAGTIRLASTRAAIEEEFKHPLDIDTISNPAN